MRIKEAKFVPMLVKSADLNPYKEALRITNMTTGPGRGNQEKYRGNIAKKYIKGYHDFTLALLFTFLISVFFVSNFLLSVFIILTSWALWLFIALCSFKGQLAY